MVRKIRKKVQQTHVEGEFIFGVHALTELLKAKRRKVFAVYTLKKEPKAWKQIAPLLPKYPIQKHHCSRDELTQKVSSSEHQGVAAFVQPYSYRTKFFEPEKAPFLLLLDGVQDVRNFGAIVRSAYCTGVNGIIVCKKGGAPLTGAALKASAGLAERIHIFQAASVSEAIQLLKKAGYSIYTTALGGKTDATVLEYKKPLCVIIGNEGKGVSKESLDAGTIVTLPQASPDVSYNASVATSIILFMISYLK